jgi:hypothetical protein
VKHSYPSSGSFRRRPTSRAVAVTVPENHTRFLPQAALLMLASIAMLLLSTGFARADQARTAGLGTLPQQAGYAFLQEALPVSGSLSGNYLAGRFAQRKQDWRAAETYMGEVARRDHANPAMQQRAFLLSLGAGRFEQALAISAAIGGDEPGRADASVGVVRRAARHIDARSFVGHDGALGAQIDRSARVNYLYQITIVQADTFLFAYRA